MVKEQEPQSLRMSLDELMGLPVTMDLPTAGRAFGVGRTKSHELARHDEFPCRVLRVGRFYRVRKADLMHELGLTVDGKPLPEASVGAA